MKRFARGALTLAFWLTVWAALALLVLAVFYSIYFAKMLAQKRRGIQTRQIGRRR